MWRECVRFGRLKAPRLQQLVAFCIKIPCSSSERNSNPFSPDPHLLPDSNLQEMFSPLLEHSRLLLTLKFKHIHTISFLTEGHWLSLLLRESAARGAQTRETCIHPALLCLCQPLSALVLAVTWEKGCPFFISISSERTGGHRSCCPRAEEGGEKPRGTLLHVLLAACHGRHKVLKHVTGSRL